MPNRRGHEALRRHRVSTPGANYFLTLCCEPRTPVLTATGIVDDLRTEISAIEVACYWTVRGAVIMPDHLHLLVGLGEALPLGRVVARLKTKTRPALIARSVTWQDNYFEHRLRPEDSCADVLRYLHLNPYRAGLLPAGEIYPHFWLGEEERGWFTALLDDGRPLATWLRD